jgi:hypothetical protein
MRMMDKWSDVAHVLPSVPCIIPSICQIRIPLCVRLEGLRPVFQMYFEKWLQRFCDELSFAWRRCGLRFLREIRSLPSNLDVFGWSEAVGTRTRRLEMTRRDANFQLRLLLLTGLQYLFLIPMRLHVSHQNETCISKFELGE